VNADGTQLRASAASAGHSPSVVTPSVTRAARTRPAVRLANAP
jgi:hypothetical protein